MKRKKSHNPAHPAIRAVKYMIAALLLSVLADAAWRYWNLGLHPDRYGATSAPWYTGVLVYAAFTAVGVGLLLVLWWVLARREKRNK